jgi:ubiquinone/menaquinone biosynthesis C-methylase UbiE
MSNNNIDEKYKNIYNNQAITYNKQRFGSVKGSYAKRYKNELIEKILKRHSCTLQGCKIVDIPSGTGRVAHMLLDKTEAHVIAVDISNDMLKVNKENLHINTQKRIDFYNANIKAIPLENGSVDAVIIASFFYLIPLDHYHSYLKDVSRIIKPNGIIVLEMSNALKLINPKTFIKIWYPQTYKTKSY